jgi:hypothetical protein
MHGGSDHVPDYYVHFWTSLGQVAVNISVWCLGGSYPPTPGSAREVSFGCAWAVHGGCVQTEQRECKRRIGRLLLPVGEVGEAGWCEVSPAR